MEVDENSTNKKPVDVNQKVKLDTKQRIEDWIDAERRRTGKKPTGDAVIRRAMDLLDDQIKTGLKDVSIPKLVVAASQNTSTIGYSPEALKWAQLAEIAMGVKRASGKSYYQSVYEQLLWIAEDALDESGRGDEKKDLPTLGSGGGNSGAAREPRKTRSGAH